MLQLVKIRLFTFIISYKNPSATPQFIYLHTVKMDYPTTFFVSFLLIVFE